MKDKRLHWV